MILTKNSVCIVAKKDEKNKRFQRNETKKGTRVRNFQKEKKLKSSSNKKGMKWDLKYMHKKFTMNLQLRSDNEKFSEAISKRKNTTWEFC